MANISINDLTVNGKDLDSPSFFSEHAIGQWMTKNHEYVMNIKKEMFRLVLKITPLGFGFCIFISCIFSQGIIGLFIPIIIGTSSIFLIILFLLINESLLLYLKMYKREREGIAFAYLKCGCRIPWIKALDLSEQIKYFGYVGVEFERCRACNSKYKLIKTWKIKVEKSGVDVKLIEDNVDNIVN